MCDFKLIAEACTAGAPVQSTVFLYTIYLYFFGTPCALPTRAWHWIHWMTGGHHENTPNWFENTILHESGLKPNVVKIW